MGDTSGTTCVPVNPTGAYTMGFDLVRNSGRQAVTVSGVRTVGGSGVEVAESYLVPVSRGGGTLAGVGPWPPENPPSSWGSQVPAVGPGKLDPAEASVDGWNLVLRLTAPGAGASYDNLALDYSLGGTPYEAINDVGLKIEVTC